MQYYLFQYRSLTYAQRAAAALERVGIPVYLLRSPRSVSPEGCSYCLRVSLRSGAEGMAVLQTAGRTPRKIFLADEGEYREVSL